MSTSNAPVRVRITIDADKTSAEFKEARRDINRARREATKRAGEKVALPAAKRLARNLKVEGRSTAGSLIVKGRANDAILTTNMTVRRMHRAVGLQEVGGTVTAPILPRKAQALTVGTGFAAHVRTPRRHKPHLFMTRAVEQNRAGIETAMTVELMRVFDGLETTS